MIIFILISTSYDNPLEVINKYRYKEFDTVDNAVNEIIKELKGDGHVTAFTVDSYVTAINANTPNLNNYFMLTVNIK